MAGQLRHFRPKFPDQADVVDLDPTLAIGIGMQDEMMLTKIRLQPALLLLLQPATDLRQLGRLGCAVFHVITSYSIHYTKLYE